MNWKIAQSIYNKIISKCPIGTFNNVVVKNAQNYSLRFCLTRRFTTTCAEGALEGRRDPRNFYKIVSMNYTTARQQHLAGGIKFINFSSETERYNAWQSYLTKFARFCVMIDESTKLAPYMDDYSEPWTDERFKEYFGLTDIEWQLIDTVIKD